MAFSSILIKKSNFRNVFLVAFGIGVIAGLLYAGLGMAMKASIAKSPTNFAIIALGNIAMAAYVLRELFAVPASGPLDAVVTRRNPGRPLLPALLAGAGLGVFVAMWGTDALRAVPMYCTTPK